MSERRLSWKDLTKQDWIAYDWSVLVDSGDDDLILKRCGRRSPYDAIRREKEFDLWLDAVRAVNTLDVERFGGEILDFRIWDHCLTAREVAKDYARAVNKPYIIGKVTQTERSADGITARIDVNLEGLPKKLRKRLRAIFNRLSGN